MTATAPRPSVITTTRTSPPARTIPTSTGKWFVVGTSDRGPLKPVKIGSLQDFVNNFGARQTYSLLYDSLDLYFRDGGAEAWISRVVGPAAVLASVNINDQAAAISLVAKAKGPGAYANTLRVTITGGGTTVPFTVTVSDTVLGTLEVSPTLADQASAIAWSTQSSWIDFTLGASSSNPAAVSNAALVGGTDDRTNIVDANWATALTKFTKDLGPGQISAPGRTTAIGKQQLRDHGAVNNRVAVVDLVDSATPATVQSAVTADLRGTNDQYVAGFAPWVQIPGLTPGTVRPVPPSALVAAKCAANDGRGKSPNVPAAGNKYGVSAYVVGLSQLPFDNGSGIDVTRDAMYAAGVNQIVFRYGQFEVFGWRSAVDPFGANQDWINFGNARLNMAITAKANEIAEGYLFEEIDGQGRLFKQFQGDLVAMLTPYYTMGSLYGDTVEEAFTVDTGPTVNTPTSINNREIHAVIGLRMSQDAELVYIEISKVPVSQPLVAA